MANIHNNGVRHGVVITSIAPPTSGSTVASGGATGGSSMETVLERLSRLEARFVGEDDRGGGSQRPDPDPPYGMPPLWKSSSWVPGGPSTSMSDVRSFTPAISTPAVTTHHVPEIRVSSGPAQTRGFGPTHTYSAPLTSTWELGPARSSWDHPVHRASPLQQGSDPARAFKLEPPIFDGSEAHTWTTRVQYYFDHILLPEEHRLHYVVMLFAPAVTDWIFAYRASNPTVSWRQFLDDVRRRFDPYYFVNYVELISKLTQTGSLADYNRDFKKLMNHIHDVSEPTLLAMYLSGLRQPLRNQVRFQHPASIASAMALSVEFDVVADRSTSLRRTWQPRDSRSSSLSGPAPSSSEPQQPTGSSTSAGRPRDYSKLPVVRLSAAERAEKSKLGLCWYCSEKWVAGHSCKSRFLAYMGPEEDDDEAEESGEPQGDVPGVVSGDLSHLYSLDGQPRASALEFKGSLGGTEVRILVDSGSTHNFVHPRVAEKGRLTVKEIRPFRVYVGNGQSLVCSMKTEGAEVRIQGHTIQLDLNVLKVHGPDVILGAPWLSALRRVTSDYEAGTIEFQHKGRPVCLRVTPTASRQVSAGMLASIMLHEGGQCFEIIPLDEEVRRQDSDVEFPEDLPDAIREVLSQHSGVFAVPSGLPPSRAFDHKIHLLPHSKPVNVRPYRYPYFQKNEIEKQVREMLDAGLIRRSSSPFSSPVLLIRKKDGSFRFCIDYRALNQVTVADNFPIPTADELFDELGAARVFTKLDLRSGYHQIRMHEEDVFKTAFRTHEGHYEFLVMPFGLTNAPSTFQAAMNEIFQPYLRRFVIVFFDDILIYSTSEDEHAMHLKEVFSILAHHHFFIKLSKCTFCCVTVEYLGHVISEGFLKADASKIEAMVAWPTPTSIRKLRGFLGLTGYYRRFISGYAMLAAPLTELLKKDSFGWSDAAEESFKALKAAMVSAPVLRLPDFSKTFYVETDASAFGVGAVLMQEEHPIAFFSKKLGPRRRVTSTYHKELYAIVEAVQKWRQYLLGREFVIRSDQKSLRELLQQVIQTPDQQLYVRKLMGYKFVIEYKTGTSNRVADALSRRDEVEDTGEAEGSTAEDASLFVAMAHPIPEVLDVLRGDVERLPELQEWVKKIHEGSASPEWQLIDGLLYRGRQIVVASNSAAKLALLYEHHATPTAGHPGVDRTLRRLATTFYWPRMRKDVKDFVASCVDCQTTKYSTQKPGGLLQPLPIPSQVWEEVSMDFITGLPQSRGSTAIMVVVDRFSKYAHFAPLPTRFDAWKVANLFVDTVVKHHGFPKELVSDRDSVFLNEVWENLLRLSGTKLNFTTAYRPQSDGQTEVRNRGLEQYLRAFVADRPTKWTSFLPWAELALNCTHHDGLGTSPFMALYGREPPPLVAVRPPAACPADVASVIRQRSDLLVTLHRNLEKAQQRMRVSANKHRRDVEFQVGDKVLLKLQRYRQHSVARPVSQKLARRFYGPFTVLERIGKVAYRLQLPEGSRIHNVFHVSLLRPFVEGAVSVEDVFPQDFARGRVVSRPTRLSECRSVLRDGKVVDEGLVHWADDDGRQPSWEPMHVISRRFPTLILEDKDIPNRGGVDTCMVEVEQRAASPEASESPSFDTNERRDEDRDDLGRASRPKRRSQGPKRFNDFILYRS